MVRPGMRTWTMWTPAIAQTAYARSHRPLRGAQRPARPLTAIVMGPGIVIAAPIDKFP